MSLTVGSLFSGIGGFDLALEREGMTVRWQVEIDLYARAILRKHWPTATLYGDIRKVRGAEVESVDVLCGGFPCQDISVAGKRRGIDGEQSGLWSEYARLIDEIRPSWAIIENSPALRTRGLSRVLRDLHASGFDAEWDGIPASAVGACHERDRIWIVAYPHGEHLRLKSKRHQRQRRGKRAAVGRDSEPFHPRRARPTPDADNQGQLQPSGRIFPLGGWSCDGRQSAPYIDGSRLEVGRAAARNPDGGPTAERGNCGLDSWPTEPDVARVVHGVPNGVDRIRCLGNAIIPPVAQLIARRIVEWEAA